jgi:hypothetical protein
MEDGGIRISYNDGNVIKSKIVYSDQTTDYGSDIKIDSGQKGDKVKNSGSSVTNGIEYWYDNYFLVYGQQDIKNKTDKKTKKRKVFYLNRIEIEG